MTTPTIVTLTGGEFVFGTAVDNTQTDDFVVSGASNQIFEGAGNLIVNGSNGSPLPYDTNTSISIGDGTGVTDSIQLNGGGNMVATTGSVGLVGSTVTVGVSGAGTGTPGGNNVTLFGSSDTDTVNLVGPTNTVTLTNSSGANSVTIVGASNTVTLVDSAGANSVNITGGGNTLSLSNSGGGNSVTINGGANSVTMNGNSANTVTITNGGMDTITVGSYDDDNWGYAATINLLGASHETVNGGDENFKVNATGFGGHDKVTVGDGENTIVTNGGYNLVTVGGGDDVIRAGGGKSVVDILGYESLNSASYADAVLGSGEEEGVTPTPFDHVVISGWWDQVNATYENVSVYALKATHAAINLGDGDNTVLLGGSSNTVNVGDGVNKITFNSAPPGSGLNNTLNVTDTTGAGIDVVFLGVGGGNTTINFDFAGGTVNGTGLGLTTVTQAAGATANLNISLAGGIGAITIGNGNDMVTANGNGTVVTAGNGNDTVNANGSGAVITLGSGNDTVNANGDGAVVTAGDGNDTVNANGAGAKITLGNGADVVVANGDGTIVTAGNGNDNVMANGIGANITLGNGNDTVVANGANTVISLGTGNENVTATGAGSQITIAGGTLSASTVTIGSGNTYLWVQNGGKDTISGGANDKIFANSLDAGSAVWLSGNNDALSLGTDSSAAIHLNHANVADMLTVQGDAGGTDSGALNVFNFNASDTMDLQGLNGANGASLNSLANVMANMTSGAFGETLNLSGGGSILFEGVTAFTSSSFAFTANTGPVHP